MFPSSLRRARAVVAATAVLTLVVACQGDEILGPPVGGACLAGHLPARDGSAEGRIVNATCRVWSPWEYDFVGAQAWTFDAKPKTAYVIRVMPQDSVSLTGPEVQPFVYGRNAAGDPVLLTYGRRRFGPASRGFELFLPSDSAATYSLRLELDPNDGPGEDSVAYRIEVSTCALLPLPLDSIVRDINSNNGCLVRSAPGMARARTTFLSFTNEELGQFEVGFNRRAGTASTNAEFAGYGVDVATLQSESFRITAPRGISYRFTQNLTALGRTTLMLSVHADSGATLEASAAVAANVRASNH